jgi:hypothetical protein
MRRSSGLISLRNRFLTGTGDAIVSGAELPPLGEDETKKVWGVLQACIGQIKQKWCLVFQKVGGKNFLGVP